MYFVYILTNWNNRVMYIGMTNDLERRLSEHKNHLIPGFTQKYNVTKLVYYEITDDVNDAIAREKQIKGWSRAKKNALVVSVNQDWREVKFN
ncbi:MAG: GIY-YIG nuclease family protein [Anaerolineaceae bacterium]